MAQPSTNNKHALDSKQPQQPTSQASKKTKIHANEKQVEGDSLVTLERLFELTEIEQQFNDKLDALEKAQKELDEATVGIADVSESLREQEDAWFVHLDTQTVTTIIPDDLKQALNAIATRKQLEKKRVVHVHDIDLATIKPRVTIDSLSEVTPLSSSQTKMVLKLYIRKWFVARGLRRMDGVLEKLIGHLCP